LISMHLLVLANISGWLLRGIEVNTGSRMDRTRHNAAAT
jgi:hypothetical protein